MKISLSAPIWSRLYGPYGVEDVAGGLRRLQTEWDEEVARDLYWEKLHHQETLYPVTYAALPWLWDMPSCPPSEQKNRLMFFSHVIDCALSAGRDPSGLYQGLGLRFEDHQQS